MSAEERVEPVRVVLVDDQPLLRSGFALILSTEEGIEVVGQAADGREAVEVVARVRPDVVLMDVQMPVLDGIEATRAVTAQTDAKVLVLTTFDRDDYLFDALAAGASGFLLKNAEAADLVEAVRTVAAGHALLAPEVTRRVIHRAAHAGREGDGAASKPQRLDRLTDREREVLVLLARGQSNAEIAGALWLGEATVKTHVSNLLAKLGVRDRVQAVIVAFEAGLVRAD